MRREMYYNELTELIIGCAYTVGRELGVGFLEKVYENALAHELVKVGLRVKQQEPIQIFYDRVLVGEYVPDFIINDEIIVELKAVKNIDSAHIAQCLNYLKATHKQICLLINFGSQRVQIKRLAGSTYKLYE